MENTNLPIMIRLGARLKVFRPGGTPLPMGQMDGIKIKDIVAKNCSNIGILVSGIPNHPVKKLVLENIDLQLNGNEKNGYANMVLPEKETDYPEIGMFGRIPASGAFLRHVEGIKIDKFTVSLKQPDMRSSLICQDGENIEFSNLEIPFDPAGEPSIRLDSCRHVSIVNLNLPGDVDSAHQLSQNGCSDITFQGK
jgi:polygalacturonase